MLFDHPAELPVATVRSRSWFAGSASRLRGGLVARWRWLQPRTVPVIVALAGMVALLASANYLTNLAHQPPERLSPAQQLEPDRVASLAVDTDPDPGILTITVGPSPVLVTIDGNPPPVGAVIEMPAAIGYQIKLIPLLPKP